MDKETVGVFQNHLDESHALQSYIKFIINIWKKDPDDDDGLEQ